MKKKSLSKTEVIDKCHVDLWKMQRELNSFGTLFRKLDTSDFQGESLYGAG